MRRLNVADRTFETVDWPASPPVDETFHLFFTFDQPREQGFAATPSNPVFRSYLQNNPTPPDPRFSQSTAPGQTTPTGADALKNWLEKRLADPKVVDINARASWEDHPGAETERLNDRLSERRRDIAKGIIANRATIRSEIGAGPGG